MKKKCCAYCGNEFGNQYQRTAEHIFPQSLLGLYPEQDVSFTPEKVFKDNSGLTIADVCNKCNNGPLSILDDYGYNLIRQQFFEEISYDLKDVPIEKEIDYDTFAKWIIKISYNYLRSRKKECEFIKKYIPSILEGGNVPDGFSMFLGLHINTTPLPEKCYEFKPLAIIEDPKPFGTSLGISVHFNLPIDLNSITIQCAYEKLLIRFGNLVVYVVFWDDENVTLKEAYIKTIIKNFPMKKIERERYKYKLRRITASTNLSLGYWHILSKSALKQDDMMVESTMHGRGILETRKKFESGRSETDWKKSQLLVESTMFPNNKKVQSEYEKIFGKQEN